MTLADLLSRWRAFLAAAAIGLGAGLLVAIIQQPRFVANMTITSLGFGETAIQAGIPTGGTGVLQALRGITGGANISSGDADYQYLVSLLMSDRTAQRLIANQEFLTTLFEPEWDKDNERWRRAPSLLSGAAALYNKVFFGQAYTAPNIPRIKERLAKVMAVQFDLETGQHIISVKSRSCQKSSIVAAAVFTAADSVLKVEKSRRFAENITYLQTQLFDQRNASLRDELASALIMQHLRQISSISNLPLAARIIDGPGCGPRPTLPQPVPYAILGAILGMAICLVWVVVTALRAASGAAARETQPDV